MAGKLTEAIAVIERLIRDSNVWYWQHKRADRKIEAAAVHIRIKALTDAVAALKEQE